MDNNAYKITDFTGLAIIKTYNFYYIYISVKSTDIYVCILFT